MSNLNAIHAGDYTFHKFAGRLVKLNAEPVALMSPEVAVRLYNVLDLIQSNDKYTGAATLNMVEQVLATHYAVFIHGEA